MSGFCLCRKDILAYGRAIESSTLKVAEITDKTKTVQAFGNHENHKEHAIANARKTCGHCGGIWPHDRSKPCPAKGKECQSCGRLNHFSRVCRSNPRPVRDNAEQSKSGMKTSKDYQWSRHPTAQRTNAFTQWNPKPVYRSGERNLPDHQIKDHRESCKYRNQRINCQSVI